MQKAMIYFAFIIKRDYKLSLELVRKLEVSPIEIMTLFEELFPKSQMKLLWYTFSVLQEF